jgi:pimeloyl-ACP methyl ester carboxylesterase
VQVQYEIDGSRYESVRFGTDHQNAPNIVLLHGGLGSVSHWKDFPQKLVERTGCNVFAYSRLGHGKSDLPKSPRRSSFLKDEARNTLPSILRQAGIVDPILLGHSDGASIALIHAAAFPHGQQAVIAIAPHVFVESKNTQAIERMREDWNDSELRLKLSRYHLSVDDTFFNWSRAWLSSTFATWDIQAELSSIISPVLVIQGVEDEFGTELQVKAILDKVVSCESFWISDCGHEPFKKHLDQTLEAVGDFIGKIMSTKKCDAT